MARIKITDLPKDKKISPDELRSIMGGATRAFDPSKFSTISALGSEIWVSTTGPTCEWSLIRDRGKIPAGAEPYIY